MKLRRAIVAYIICAVVVISGFISLISNLSPMLDQADSDLAEGRSLVLDSSLQADSLAAFLLEGDYVTDRADARLISIWITGKIAQTGELTNLGQLNSPTFKIPADTIMRHGGQGLKSRVQTDYLALGIDDEWNRRPDNLTSEFGDKNAGGTITVKLTNDDRVADAPLEGVPVRLREHRYTTLRIKGNSIDTLSQPELETSTLGYAVTDGSGRAIFHVAPGGSYSVLPVKPGYQYGHEKGTTDGPMGSSLDLSFRQSRHVMSPFDTSSYQMIKQDRALMVRTPSAWLKSVWTGLAIFLLGWAGVIALVAVRDRMMHTSSDYLLLTVLMAITGIGLLAAYAINNPLTDKPNGYTTAMALAVGLGVLAAISCINFKKFYNGKSRVQMSVIPFDLVDSLMRRRSSTSSSLDKERGISFSSGFMYLLIALGFITLLALFGTGPEGSDARVNLGSFQPSELSKYLIVIFIAAFMAENAMLIQAFSQKATRLTLRRQLGVSVVIIAVMLVLMLIYLKVLSDMGPAIVLLITFILLYSMARRDFGQLLIGLATFIAMMVGAWLISHSPAVLLVVALLWFAGWYLYGRMRNRQVYESAIFLNLLIVAFALGGYILQAIGAESEAQRLLNRTAMAWGGVWDNSVAGGDQVAQGLWSLSTGGFSGLGLGNGNPSLVPAAHTDMVFTSIGEMLGLAGLILVTLCFVILVHRSLLIGRKAAHPFVMYLVMGIAIVTGVQFLFIVMGSLGLIPLTGISVPLLSYGRTGLIITLAAMGIVVSASRMEATESQRKHAMTYNNAIAAGALLFILGGIIITGTLVKYQIIDRDEILMRPALITNTEGARIVEYNPRISLVLSRMNAGNIYDRNGVLLATSSRDELFKAKDQLLKAGLTEEQISAEASRRKRRYYPFGQHTLFMTGDANTRKVYGTTVDNPIGYVAEYRHFSDLRGIDIPYSTMEMSSDEYRENRFMPKTSATFKRTRYDYSTLLPYLDYGLDQNPRIEEHNAARAERDLYLTIDASLQTEIQNELARKLPEINRLKDSENIRASLVVLDAASGDLLTSANYPLPHQDTIAMLSRLRIYNDQPHERIAGHAPITERDLGLTFQTQPGSTAKVMSAMAALIHDPELAGERFQILNREIVHHSDGNERAGWMTMHDAIVHSSNNYFIGLTNAYKLYPELEQVYTAVGARVSNDQASPVKSATPYYLEQGELDSDSAFHAVMNNISRESYRVYDRHYMKERDTGKPTKGHNGFRWNMWGTGMAWGQGGLRATPLNMARVAAIVANGGVFVPTRYVLQSGEQPADTAKAQRIMTPQAASTLASYMIDEATAHSSTLSRYTGSSRYKMGGKTGTPERGTLTGESINDAWYIFFIKSNDPSKAPLAMALRLERTAGANSGAALEVVEKIVMPVIINHFLYLKDSQIDITTLPRQ